MRKWDMRNAADAPCAMQLMRHTPRYETSQNPTIHVEELKEKVSVRGSVISVGRVSKAAMVSFLNFRCQVRMLPLSTMLFAAVTAAVSHNLCDEFGMLSLCSYTFPACQCPITRSD